jgi:hypothetical protein
LIDHKIDNCIAAAASVAAAFLKTLHASSYVGMSAFQFSAFQFFPDNRQWITINR